LGIQFTEAECTAYPANSVLRIGQNVANNQPRSNI